MWLFITINNICMTPIPLNHLQQGHYVSLLLRIAINNSDDEHFGQSISRTGSFTRSRGRVEWWSNVMRREREKEKNSHLFSLWIEGECSQKHMSSGFRPTSSHCRRPTSRVCVSSREVVVALLIDGQWIGGRWPVVLFAAVFPSRLHVGQSVNCVHAMPNNNIINIVVRDKGRVLRLLRDNNSQTSKLVEWMKK